MKTPTETTNATILLWKTAWGRISKKPVACIDLGDGFIHVTGSCLIRQKRDEPNSSFHPTYKEALIRLLADSQRNLNRAKKDFESAKRKLDKVKSQWMNFIASPYEPT